MFRLCDAVPSFDRSELLEGGDHTGLQIALAYHVVDSVAWARPQELATLFAKMEELYAQAEVTDDEDLSNALTIGFLETLLHVAEDRGLDFRKLAQEIAGERTKDAWETALAYEKPEFSWDDAKGLIPLKPLPTAVGTVRVHRGWSDRAAGQFVIELQRISGEIHVGYLLRYRISAGHYFTGHIAAVKLRSTDVPDEYEVRLTLEHEYQFEAWEAWMGLPHEEFWQIAVPNTSGDDAGADT
jgi:hypothetical protein